MMRVEQCLTIIVRQMAHEKTSRSYTAILLANEERSVVNIGNKMFKCLILFDKNIVGVLL